MTGCGFRKWSMGVLIGALLESSDQRYIIDSNPLLMSATEFAEKFGFPPMLQTPAARLIKHTAAMTWESFSHQDAHQGNSGSSLRGRVTVLRSNDHVTRWESALVPALLNEQMNGPVTCSQWQLQCKQWQEQSTVKQTAHNYHGSGAF